MVGEPAGMLRSPLPMGQGKFPKGCWGLGLLSGVLHMMLFCKNPSADLHLNHTQLNFSRDASRMRCFTKMGIEQDQQTKGALPMLPPITAPISALVLCVITAGYESAGGGVRGEILLPLHLLLSSLRIKCLVPTAISNQAGAGPARVMMLSDHSSKGRKQGRTWCRNM